MLRDRPVTRSLPLVGIAALAVMRFLSKNGIHHKIGDVGTAVAADGGRDLAQAADTPRTDNDLKLLPYRQWEARAVYDPRSVTDQEVLAALMDIIEAEGPMPCR